MVSVVPFYKCTSRANKYEAVTGVHSSGALLSADLRSFTVEDLHRRQVSVHRRMQCTQLAYSELKKKKCRVLPVIA